MTLFEHLKTDPHNEWHSIDGTLYNGEVMLTIRRAEQRFHTSLGWLDSRHSFSFAEHYDPDQIGFRALRVINEDRVQPGRGFGTHPHRDMEILSYVLDGELEHKDSMGNGSIIRPGEIQRLSAGTGVLHSEFNPSPKSETHFLQIWIVPSENGLEPSYEQKSFGRGELHSKLYRIAGRDPEAGAVTVHQDVDVYATLLEPGEQVSYSLAPWRYGWVQVARGEVTVNGTPLRTGDGAALSEQPRVELIASAPAEVLLFDLA